MNIDPLVVSTGARIADIAPLSPLALIEIDAVLTAAFDEVRQAEQQLCVLVLDEAGQAERERCARLLDMEIRDYTDGDGARTALQLVAAAIRALD